MEIIEFFPVQTDFKITKSDRLSTMSDYQYHDHYEIYYLISGTQKYFIENAFYHLHTGEVALIAANVLHKTTRGMGGPHIVCRFNNQFLSKHLSQNAIDVVLQCFNHRIIKPDTHQEKILADLFNQLCDEKIARQEQTRFALVLKILMILNAAPYSDTATTFFTPTFGKIVQYMQENFANIQSMNDVSNALFISNSQICRLFAQSTYKSFNTHLLQIRLKEAEKLLLHSKKNISAIAEECGFATTTYFCNVFKKHFNLSPLTYRKTYAIN